METPIILVVVLALSVVNLSESSLEVHLDASNHLPTHIGEDIALSLKCSFFSNDSHDDFQSIYEISICEVDKNKETKLATFNALVDDILLFINNVSTKVEGKAYTTNGYLKLDTIDDKAARHNFSCTVKYVDRALGFKTITANTAIKGNNIFNLLNEKFTAHEARFSKIERNLTGLEGRLSALEVQMSNVNNKLSSIDKTLSKIESTISQFLNLTGENQSNITRLQSSVEENQRKMEGKLNHTRSRIVQSCNELTVNAWPRHTIKTGDGTTYLCDTVTDNGGWTVFQRRLNGQQNFYQNWTMYENGFGDVHNNFWLGLAKIRNLIKDKPHELRVDIQYQGKSYYAHYKSFDILDASTNYTLLVSGFDGSAGDALAYHNNMSFTTFDRDNDLHVGNCAVDWTGGWWYNNCHDAHLNGRWGSRSGRGLQWRPPIDGDSATFTEMKMRPTQ